MIKSAHTILNTIAIFLLAMLLMCTPDPVPQQARICISIQGAGTVQGLPTDTSMIIGDSLLLSAIPDSSSGYIFGGWKLDTFYNQNPLRLMVTRDISINAYFVKKPQGLVRIPSNGKTFSMGSTDPYALEFEKPVHTVRFNHDFYIADHEVTQAEYRQLMHKNPDLMANSSDTGDNFPVFYVSWYDAVLYCNERSKKEGYDTVYSYSSICRNAGSCSFILENLKINYDRYGYRLPTEAEWEYACRGGTVTEFYWGAFSTDEAQSEQYAWYTKNSQNKSHPVALKMPNAFGLYDMCGNVGEWVNDWLESYNDSSVVDPVGPTHLSQEQFERSYERPIRGGTYRSGVSLLRSSTRKGDYPTPPFIYQVDIGFRVTLGAFQASTFTPSPAVIDSIGFTVRCTKTDLVQFFGTSRIKSVFVSAIKHRKHLYLIDFTGDDINISRIGTDSSVVSPVISPDGNYVCYGSATEGTTGPSVSTIRSLKTGDTAAIRFNGYFPRFWVSPNSADTFLIYSDGASMNNTPKWFTEKTYRHQIKGGMLIGSRELLTDRGSYHGGLSRDGRFLTTSYPKARMIDLPIKDTNIFLFTAPFNGTDDDGQVCNLSVSPSRTDVDEVMFVDFGYTGVSRLLNKPYGIHSVIFICNSTLYSNEQVRRWFEKPQGYDRWDFPEWSNHPSFAAAIARTNNYSSNSLFGINCKDSLYQEIARGETIRDVWLWIDPLAVSEGIDPYPHFGKYDQPIRTNGQLEMSKKLHLFWRYRNEVECAIVGCSPAYFGIDPSKISLRCLNLAAPGYTLMTTMLVTKNYILQHSSPNLRVIVAELIPYLMSIDANTMDPKGSGLYESNGFIEDKSHNFYRDSLPEVIQNKISLYTQKQWEDHDSSGFYRRRAPGSGWGMPDTTNSKDFNINDSVVQVHLSTLIEMIELATKRGIHVLLVNLPQNPLYKDMNMMGYLGPSYTTYHKIVAHIDSIMTSNKLVHFYDAGNGGNHDFTSDEAWDRSHLNYKGAAKMGAKIDSVIQLILEN